MDLLRKMDQAFHVAERKRQAKIAAMIAEAEVRPLSKPEQRTQRIALRARYRALGGRYYQEHAQWNARDGRWIIPAPPSAV